MQRTLTLCKCRKVRFEVADSGIPVRCPECGRTYMGRYNQKKGVVEAKGTLWWKISNFFGG